MIRFCGEAKTDDTFLLRAKVDGVVALPSSMMLAYENAAGAAVSNCAAFYQAGVSAGTKTVSMQWSGNPLSTPPVHVGLAAWSMIIMTNIH